MASADFWLDWTVHCDVDRLRKLVAAALATTDYRAVEVSSVATGPDWAMIHLLAGDSGHIVGVARAQSATAGSAQMFVGPGPARDKRAAEALNDIGLELFARFLLAGVLDPPPPLKRRVSVAAAEA